MEATNEGVASWVSESKINGMGLGGNFLSHLSSTPFHGLRDTMHAWLFLLACSIPTTRHKAIVLTLTLFNMLNFM